MELTSRRIAARSRTMGSSVWGSRVPEGDSFGYGPTRKTSLPVNFNTAVLEDRDVGWSGQQGRGGVFEAMFVRGRCVDRAVISWGRRRSAAACSVEPEACPRRIVQKPVAIDKIWRLVTGCFRTCIVASSTQDRKSRRPLCGRPGRRSGATLTARRSCVVCAVLRSRTHGRGSRPADHMLVTVLSRCVEHRPQAD